MHGMMTDVWFTIFMVYYWPAQWASIVLLAGVCCLSSSSDFFVIGEAM